MYQPLVSVIIPAYNAEKYLVEAVNSVYNQNYSNLEIIIIDDGSTDKTAEIVSGLKGNIRYFYQKNSGAAVARNTGIKEAKGEIITFLDADDLWAEGKIKRELENFTADSALEMVIGFTQLLRVKDDSNPDLKIFEPTEQPRMEYLFGSAAFRREVFDKVGLLDPSLQWSEDTDWFLRVRDFGIKKIVTNEVALFYRFHGENNTFRYKNRHNYLLRAFHSSIIRRRLTKNKPLVSVIIPAYNAEKYLVEAVNSVYNQNYSNLEIIIIDDGSTDNTRKIAKSISRVNYFYQNHLGPGAGRNLAIKEAKGEYLAFLDADDLWAEGKLEAQIEYLYNHLEIDIVFGQVEEFCDRELEDAITCRKKIVAGIIPSAMLVKKSSFLKVGWFEENWRKADFSSWYAKSLETGLHIASLEKIVAYRRIHQANTSNQNLKEYVLSLKEHLDRQRGIIK